MSIVFYILLAFILYNLIFRLVIPLYRTTKRVRRTFRDMQEQMQGRTGAATSAQPKPDPVAGKGEYIDFEEVKD